MDEEERELPIEERRVKRRLETFLKDLAKGSGKMNPTERARAHILLDQLIDLLGNKAEWREKVLDELGD